MPAPESRRVLHHPSQWPLPLPSKKRTPPPHIESLMDSLDGRDLDHTLRVASSIMREGEWRSWMVKWFMRLHRHEVTRLMRRLGPMIPPARSR